MKSKQKVLVCDNGDIDTVQEDDFQVLNKKKEAEAIAQSHDGCRASPTAIMECITMPARVIQPVIQKVFCITDYRSVIHICNICNGV